ncbi:MAG TPA: AI-2E family transporter [Tepidisphaeraceae bacterium]|nr:AI-2E family transporter [Tepidisphaeraceae bacterium]
MAQAENRDGGNSAVLILAAIAIVVAGLYFAQSVLIPLALAVLLSFLLAPLVKRLERLGLHRIIAVLLTAGLLFTAIAAAGWIVWVQVADLARKAPEYQDNIQLKVEGLRRSAGGMVSKAAGLFSQVNQELSISATQPTPPQPATVADLGPTTTTRPVRVEVVEPPPAPARLLFTALGPIIGPLGTAGLVVIFVVFILIQQEDLRDRVIRLVSHGQLNITTQALDDAARRVSRYLLMQLVVNVTYGIPIAIGLLLIGVPNAIFWGLLATVLRFIPYIGPWLAAAGPLLLSLAVSQTWTIPILTASLYIVVELISNNAVEPLLYGSSTGISSVAVLVAAVFWTWLWGIPGLLLATPMTVLLAVVGKYVPQLQFLSVLLGDEPVLDPRTRVYQRLLAWDAEEAGELVDEFLGEKSLLEVYDQVLIPALGLAEEDYHRGALDERRRTFIHDSIKEIMEDLADRRGLPQPQAAQMSSNGQDASSKREGAESASRCALCIPARDEADAIVAMMLAQVLQIADYPARYIPKSSLASDMVDTAVQRQSKIICLSAMPPAAAAHVRYLAKRLEGRLAESKFIIGLWGARGDLARIKERVHCDCAGPIVRTLAEATEQIVPLLQVQAAQAHSKTTSPAQV